MLILETDITAPLQVLFDTISNIYNLLNCLEFTAFGFNFTFLGLFLAFIVLAAIIKFIKFGFEEGASSSLRYSRVENNSNSERLQNAKLGTEKSQRKNGTYNSKWI